MRLSPTRELGKACTNVKEVCRSVIPRISVTAENVGITVKIIGITGSY